MVLDDVYAEPRRGSVDQQYSTAYGPENGPEYGPENGHEHAGDRAGLSKSIEKSLAAPIDRLAAVAADFILAVPVITLVVAPLSRRAKEAQVLGAEEAWLTTVISAIALGAFALILFQTVSIALFGATPGKRILKLRVVSMWTGEKPLPLEAFARALVWCLELGLLGVPLLSVFANYRRRPFHDRIADTAVISLAKARRAGPADLPEMSVFSGFQAACLAVVLFVFSVNFVEYQQHHDATLEATLQREDSGRLCQEVRDAIRESSARKAGANKEQKKDRLEVALSLFNSGTLSSECLDSEAEFALWREQMLPLAYLAKGLVAVEKDETVGRAYLDKACEKARAHEQTEEFADVCRLSVLARAGLKSDLENELDSDPNEAKLATVRREVEVEAIFSTLETKTKSYLKIAAIRNLSANGEDERALSILNGLNEPKSLGPFIAGERAKALWRLGRKSEALAAMRSLVALSDRPARVETARWFCYQETDLGRCGIGPAAACAELKAVIDDDDTFLKKADVAIAYIRATSCGIEKPNWRELAGKVPLSEAKDYLESLALLAEGDIETGTTKLRTIAEKSTSRSQLFALEANAMLINRTQSREELETFKSDWEQIKPSASEWRILGRHLLARMSHFGAWDDAINIGLRLVESDPGDRETYKLMISAAKSAGKLQMALGLLAQIPGRKPAAESSEEAP